MSWFWAEHFLDFLDLSLVMFLSCDLSLSYGQFPDKPTAGTLKIQTRDLRGSSTGIESVKNHYKKSSQILITNFYTPHWDFMAIHAEIFGSRICFQNLEIQLKSSSSISQAEPRSTIGPSTPTTTRVAWPTFRSSPFVPLQDSTVSTLCQGILTREVPQPAWKVTGG